MKEGAHSDIHHDDAAAAAHTRLLHCHLSSHAAQLHKKICSDFHLPAVFSVLALCLLLLQLLLIFSEVGTTRLQW